MYFVYRDGEYIDASGQSFRDYMDGKLPARPGFRPTLKDWADHSTTAFPEVRLKKYLEMRGADSGGTGGYAELGDTPGNLHIEVQKVDHPSRVHLDIEADDIDAEAARLEALGARKIAFVKRWWLMEAPTGQRFCVVRMRDEPGRAAPNEWP
jgi:hypothetical protein